MDSGCYKAPYSGQPLCAERVIPALHVVPRELVLAEHSYRLAVFAALDSLDHLVKISLVAFIL